MNGSHKVPIRKQLCALLLAGLLRSRFAGRLSAIGFFLLASAAYAAGPLAYLFQPTETHSALPGATFQNAPYVYVQDASYNPLSGILVTFTAPGSGASGTFSNGDRTISVYSSGGIATTSFKANSIPGTYTVNASALVLSPFQIISTDIQFTNIGPATLTLTATSATIPTGGVYGIILDATVLDSAGEPVSGYPVTFSAASTGPSGVFMPDGTSSAAASTHTDGVANVRFTSNSISGPYTVTAFVITPTFTFLSASVDLDNIGPPAFVTPLAGTTPQSAVVTEFFAPLAVKVTDAANQPLEGIAVTFQAPPPATGYVSIVSSANTDASGTASIYARAGSTSGSYQVFASVPGATTAIFNLTNIGLPATITPLPGTTPQSAAVGTAFQTLAVKLLDAANNPLPGYVVDFSSPTSGASATFLGLNSIGGASDSNGIVSVAFQANSIAGSYSVTATVRINKLATSFALTNTPTAIGPAITQNPANVAANVGATAQFTATASGNPAPTVQWQQSTDGGASFSNLAGATSTNLSFTAASAQNGHLFRAVFTNSVGTSTTTAAALTVQVSCDVNGDGHTNISDIQLVIDEALGKSPAVHDFTADGAVTVIDVQIGLGCTMNNGTLPASSQTLLRPLLLPSRVVAANFDPAVQSFPVTDLGSLSGLPTAASAINNLGQVVGASGSRAFLWDAGRMTDLNVPVDGNATHSAAYSINDAGQIAGDYWHADQQGGSFLYDAGHIALLSNAPGSSVSAINNLGQAVGDLSRASAAFLWNAGTLTALETFGGSDAHPSAINDLGQIAGFTYVRDHSARHAFRYDGPVTTDLGTLGGTNSFAFAINIAGQVVGSSQTIDNSLPHAFLYTGGSMTDLGTLGGADSQADGINSRGLIVGWARTTGGDQHAFLWRAGRMFDLNSLASLGADSVLVEATAINDVGQVVANGSNGRAYLIVLPAQLQ